MAEIEGKHSNAQQPFSAIAMQTPAMATSFSGENNLADRVGFEPTVRLPHAGFQDQCLQPLGHLSTGRACDGKLSRWQEHLTRLRA